MASSALSVAVERDQAALRKRLRDLGGGDADARQRDEFLDEWVAYNSAVGLVLFDNARHKLEGGDAIVDNIRKDLPAFQQSFAELENADDIAAVAKAVAPAFEAQLDRVMGQIVGPVSKQLEDDEIAQLASRYVRSRAPD